MAEVLRALTGAVGLLITAACMPVTLTAGASDEYVSEYLLVTVPSTAPPIVSVTYDLPVRR